MGEDTMQLALSYNHLNQHYTIMYVRHRLTCHNT